MADTLWDNAKTIEGEDNHRIWLVWTIGTYATGLPWIELRAIYTSEEWANNKAKSIRECEKRNYPNQLGMMLDRVHVEPRVTNHYYGGDMMEMAAHMGLI